MTTLPRPDLSATAAQGWIVRAWVNDVRAASAAGVGADGAAGGVAAAEVARASQAMLECLAAVKRWAPANLASRFILPSLRAMHLRVEVENPAIPARGVSAMDRAKAANTVSGTSRLVGAANGMSLTAPANASRRRGAANVTRVVSGAKVVSATKLASATKVVSVARILRGTRVLSGTSRHATPRRSAVSLNRPRRHRSRSFTVSRAVSEALISSRAGLPKAARHSRASPMSSGLRHHRRTRWRPVGPRTSKRG